MNVVDFSNNRVHQGVSALRVVSSIGQDGSSGELIIVNTLDIPRELELADPSFNSPNIIDTIIGSKIFFELICAYRLKPTSYGPTFQNTLFGFIV